MRKRKNIIDVTSQRQLEMLGKYFPIDHENKIVTIKIYYDKASDLLDFTVGELHMELFSNEVFEKIADIVSKVPLTYKADVIFVIDDYDSYDPKLLLEKLNDKIEINNYVIVRDRRKKWLITVSLVMTGLALLFVLQLAKKYSWFGTGIRADILTEALDIVSWVFIWEAVTVLFLSPSDLKIVQFNLFNRINTISFSNKKENVLLKEKMDEVVNNAGKGTKKLDILNILLLITSTFLLVSAVYGFVVYLIDDIEIAVLVFTSSTVGTGEKIGSIIFILAVDAILFSMQFLIGLLGVRRYLAKPVSRILFYILLSIQYILFAISIVTIAISAETASYIKTIIDAAVLLIFTFTAMRIDRLRRVRSKKQSGELK